MAGDPMTTDRDDETVQPCPEGVVDFAAHDGRLVLTMREAPGAPIVAVTCGYSDCEWVLAAIYSARQRKPFDHLLSRGAAASEDRRLLFATVGAEAGKVTWEVAAPFGIMGWRWDMTGHEIVALEDAVREAMRQEDEKL